MARYFVTGVAGFIAARVATMLLRDGHTVWGMDNLNETYDVRLKQWRLAQLTEHPSFQFHELDICDRNRVASVFALAAADGASPADAVIHLAARAGVPQSVIDPWAYFETNAVGTLSMLELCREYGVRTFLLASTSSVYGADSPQPFREDAQASRPLSPYAASKKAAETICYSYHSLYGMSVSILRYFTVYGPAGRPDMSLFRFVQWISEGRPVVVFGDGLQSRDFTYVDDIARGTIAGLGITGYEIINLGSDQPVVLLDAIHLIEDLIGKRAQLEFRPRHPSDVTATWADIGKARRLLGWQPDTPLEAGVGQLVSWYQSQRTWARDIQT
jgi:nucleoside-diphosphate-sugar epimerase